ncbi:MAG: NAD+ synthase [Spirochaetales bacterium]|nr:NAD+ synthase [Spirochaetales bacterium]
MRIALGQINPLITGFSKNAEKILTFIKQAVHEQADIIVFPEMCVCGYPPMDLLDLDNFVEECLKAVRFIQHKAPKEIAVLIGYIDQNRAHSGKPLVNTVSLIHNNQIIFSQAKTLLPTYDVFDEARYFEPAKKRNVIEFNQKKIGITICEDIWWEQEKHSGEKYAVDPVIELLDKGAEILMVPSASPFFSGKPELRFSLISDISKKSHIPVIYVNMVGANDSLIFDGQSMYVAKDGSLSFRAKGFKEDFAVIDTEKKSSRIRPYSDKYAEIEQALILGIRDYLRKCGFEHVHLGLSGGIDSALVTVLAVRALGSKHVKAFAMPSRYSSEASLIDAQQLCKNVGVDLEVISIEDIFPHYLKSLDAVFKNKKADITEENLQARIRSTLLMAYANKFNSLLLATGNKSELATGYCTLYGDMSGALAVIGDLFKTEVYELARAINTKQRIIPESILSKAPSAELRPAQTDQDTLPPYDLLDKILYAYILQHKTKQQLIEMGFEKDFVKQVLGMVARAEYKRRQAPPVLKVSPRAFGTGRRIPIARSIFEA